MAKESVLWPFLPQVSGQMRATGHKAIGSQRLAIKLPFKGIMI